MSTILTGPWFQCEADPGGYTPKTLVASIRGGIEIHAHHDVGTEDRIAIAAAIVALPDMLAALRDTRDKLHGYVESFDAATYGGGIGLTNWTVRDGLDCLVKRIDAAIAKATGGAA